MYLQNIKEFQQSILGKNIFKYLHQDLTDLEGKNVTIIFGRNLENLTIVQTAAAQNCDDGVSLKDTQWTISRLVVRCLFEQN